MECRIEQKYVEELLSLLECLNNTLPGHFKDGRIVIDNMIRILYDQDHDGWFLSIDIEE